MLKTLKQALALAILVVILIGTVGAFGPGVAHAMTVENRTIDLTDAVKGDDFGRILTAKYQCFAPTINVLNPVETDFNEHYAQFARVPVYDHTTITAISTNWQPEGLDLATALSYDETNPEQKYAVINTGAGAKGGLSANVKVTYCATAEAGVRDQVGLGLMPEASVATVDWVLTGDVDTEMAVTGGHFNVNPIVDKYQNDIDLSADGTSVTFTIHADTVVRAYQSNEFGVYTVDLGYCNSNPDVDVTTCTFTAKTGATFWEQGYGHAINVDYWQKSTSPALGCANIGINMRDEGDEHCVLPTP